MLRYALRELPRSAPSSYKGNCCVQKKPHTARRDAARSVPQRKISPPSNIRCIAGAHSERAANSLMTSRSAGHEMAERKKNMAPR